MTGTAPLSGLRVLDLTELLPGPYATQQLAEMGAEVIKVERPAGDAARAMFPGLFAAVNRGKKSIFPAAGQTGGRRDRGLSPGRDRAAGHRL